MRDAEAPKRVYTKKNTPRYVRIKLLKTKTKALQATEKLYKSEDN